MSNEKQDEFLPYMVLKENVAKLEEELAFRQILGEKRSQEMHRLQNEKEALIQAIAMALTQIDFSCVKSSEKRVIRRTRKILSDALEKHEYKTEPMF